MKQAIIVIPCYNEARRLRPVLFLSFLAEHPGVTLLFVNDGSRDGTGEVLEGLRSQRPEQILVLPLPRNGGKAEAVRQGMLLALGEQPQYAGYWDADLATPLEAIPPFCQVLDQRPQVQLVMGSRVCLLGRRIERAWRRRLLGRLFACCASAVLNLPVYDTQCGAKLFRASRAVAELFADPFGSRWIFDVELLARLQRAAPQSGWGSAREVVYELPLEDWRDVDGSKLKSRDFVRAMGELAAIYRAYRRPGTGPPGTGTPGTGTRRAAGAEERPATRRAA